MDVLANPVRIRLLHRLRTPAFMTDLVPEFGISRQALKRHLEALEEIGLVNSRRQRAHALRATAYTTDPSGLFALKEEMMRLAVDVDPELMPSVATIEDTAQLRASVPEQSGLLLVHGDRPGRFFPLEGRSGPWVIGRGAGAHVSLPYDPFASTRHALLTPTHDGLRLRDLESTNGTRVDFRTVRPGMDTPVARGDLITVGRSHLLLRGPY